MRLLYPLLLSCLLACNFFPTHAVAKTGSFDTTITFLGSTRKLSCYVPANYNAANKYRLMVCLHGLGDNSANYRSALISSLAWSTNFPNTIFICPEAATTTADFYQPVGGEAIVQKCIDLAMANYHIDTSNVILEGFSLGGRAALRYGLDNYKKFKGLLLNTPAIQGVKNALNDQPTYRYTYANSSHIPIYITHGVADVGYEPPIDTALKLMILNDGIIRYNDVPNMAHNIPSFKVMADVLTFFDTPARPGKDLEVFELDAPERTCSASVTPGIIIRNTGSETITSANFTITLNGQPQTFAWNGALVPFQHATVALPTLLPASGPNILDIKVATINNVADTIVSEKIDTFEYVSSGISLPVSEGFEESTFPPPGWMLAKAGDVYYPWFQDTVRKSGALSAGAFNSIWIFDNQGRAEGLVSPVMNLVTIPSPQLSFDVAYNYHRYTPPYATQTTDLTDTLDILISTDCGATYTSLFRKFGANLATFAEPILNSLSIQTDFIVPKDTNWRKYTIDLSHYATAPEAIVKFNYISGLGGSIYLDNVSVGGADAVQARPTPVSYRVYPNPATDWVTLVGEPGSQVHIIVSDIAGHQVLSTEGMTDGSGEFLIDTHALIAGVYLIRTSVGQSVRTEKLIIRH
jgi:predicted esterase